MSDLAADLSTDTPAENVTVEETPVPVEPAPEHAVFRAHTLHNIVDEIEARWKR